MASQRADLSGGPAMKKPRVEAASWSFMDDLPDIQYRQLQPEDDLALFRRTLHGPTLTYDTFLESAHQALQYEA